MDERILGALITGLTSLAVALIGLATARRKDEAPRAARRTLAPGTVEQRLWGGVVVVVLVLVVAEAVAPAFGDRVDFPPQAYPFLISGLVFWLYLGLSGRNDGNGKGPP